MIPKLIVIDTLDGLLELRSYLINKEYIAYDCETTGLTRQDRIIGFSICAEEAIAYYVILEKWNGQLVPMPYLIEARNLIISLQDKQLIMHNSIFDCLMAESYFKVNLMPSVHTDTLILAHLLDENSRVGLKELGNTIFGNNADQESKEMKDSVIANGGKLTKNCYEMYKCDSAIMGKYGAKDAWLTYKLFIYLVPKLYAQELNKFFYEDESMPLLRGPTYDLNTTGLMINTNTLAILKKTLEAECEEDKTLIYREIKEKIKDKYAGTNKNNTFNIGSSQQLAWLLYSQYGCQFDKLTKAGRELAKRLGIKATYSRKNNRIFIETCIARKGDFYAPMKKVRNPWVYIACDKNTLKRLSEKYKWVEILLDYNKKQKLLNTYVIGIESRLQYGIIRPVYLQHGTMTGRYASRNPNLQNLPRGDQRIKECFIARPEKVFVSADFSQLEPRVFSYYSQDKRLMDAFNGDTDFYSVVGQGVFDKYDCKPKKEGVNSFGEKYPDLRQDSKTIALARAYGATPYQLAPILNKSEEETIKILLKLDITFPGIRKMMLDAHILVKNTGCVTNLFGRVRHLPQAKVITELYGNIDHWELPYEARRLLNMACNFRIQSTGASIVNRAAIKFYNNAKELNINCKIVSQIHDELVIECNAIEAKSVALLLQNAMENTTILEGIKLEAIPRITKTLSK